MIEYWHCNAETQGGLTVEELVNKFNEENDHIEVVAKCNPDMYKGLMQNLQAEAAGNTPAVVQIGWAFLDYFSNNLSAPVLYINRDILKEAGLSEEGPQTWEEGCQSFIDGNVAKMYTTIARRATVQECRQSRE